MTVYNKIKWVLGILMVLGLIALTNLIDRSNFVRVKDSITTIYEDRLVANDLIFEMLESIHKKEVAIALTDSSFFTEQNYQINNNLQELVSRFEQTKLTTNEQTIFKNFKTNLGALDTIEQKYIQSNLTENSSLKNKITDLKSNLASLSKIQLDEGRKQMSISKKAIDTVELFTQIEIYILILLAIIVQIVVMYNPKKS
ncbi:MCP four helix bundle domain-containing protein [Kordia algicida OT-1]|uniref:Chemotaxis methyl-accepting receptor HlyB-like 4HB MCP domain-containing protein n=1 Tax=Kordia algicida OT-1 TaxID=391587 RepID=A9EA75_9FLAO|nr:MCP four helix bundle domain-containing protein [Kordia algicida]EDP94753.1 hypothetical protein KAOT1_00715 [Kordia algicida OT-1]